MKARRILTIGLLALVTVSTGALIAQTPQAVGTWAPLRELTTPVPNGATVALPDGRTLIAGGPAAGNTAADGVTIYDPVNDTSIAAGNLVVPRSAHTATPLKDGRVLIVGGVTDAGVISTDIERFDPATGTSEIVGQLAEPRRGHVAATLLDGTVLIAGGATTDGRVLQSAAIFDPETNSVMPLPAGLQVARVNASATTLLDGRVLIAGGSNGSVDLASAEVFERYWQTFATAATQMSVPRQGHSAVMLPHNGGVLFAGGTSNGAAVAGTDLFLPAVFPDPFSYGEGEFTTTGAMAAARAAVVAGPTSVEGFASGAGAGERDAEVYRFATIKTDKEDYAPGASAVITGSGWQPGEEVTLLFQEDPAVHEDYVLKVNADTAGNIYWDQWAPELHDLNVRFYLTASGSRSRAQTTFTDGNVNVKTVGAATAATLNWARYNNTTCNGTPAASGSISADTNGNGTGIPSGAAPGSSLRLTAQSLTDHSFSHWSGDISTPVPDSSTSICVEGRNSTRQIQVNYTASIPNATPTITFNPAPTPTFGGGNFTVSAQTTNTDSSALTYSVVTGPCALVTNSTFTSSGAGACEVRASGAATAHFTAASTTQTVTIAKAAVTVAVTCPASVTYNGSAQEPCTATVTGAGGLDETLTVSYSDNTNAGTATASASYTESANHQADSDTKTFNIAKAPVTVAVTCPASVTYNGSAQEPCSATVTGAGGLNETLTVSYSDNTNAGTATASASYTESANHQAGSDTKTFNIAKAPVTVAVTCPASVTYNGSAQTPCTAIVTGAGALNQPLTVSYINNTNAGTATASAGYAESANHLGNSGSKEFTINRQALTITPEGGKTKLLGATFTAFTGTVAGLQGTDAGMATYASPGAAAAAAVGSYDIIATGFVFTSGSESNYYVTYETAANGLVVVYRWDGFLQPINDTAHDLAVMSKFKVGQTIPAKFVLKNAAGVVVQQTGSPEFGRSASLGACDTNSIAEDVPALTADVVPQYKWDGSQYHYNWSTKGLTGGLYRIFATLGDGTTQSVNICLTK